MDSQAAVTFLKSAVKDKEHLRRREIITLPVYAPLIMPQQPRLGKGQEHMRDVVGGGVGEGEADVFMHVR